MKNNNIYLSVFCLIVCLTSVLFIVLAETIWFPIKYHDTDTFIPYFSHRKAPFEYFYFAFTHFYVYYILIFSCMTFFHILLYQYLYIAKKNIFSKCYLYLTSMFLAGFLLYLFNRWYRLGFKAPFFKWIFMDGLSFYIEMLFNQYQVISLYIIISISSCVSLTYIYKHISKLTAK